MSAPPLAHLGHWYVSLPVFMGPVALIALALKVQTWREGRQGGISAKRSTVTLSRGHAEADTIVLAGPLDYPALLELEGALAAVAAAGSRIVIDLLRVTEANQEAAWGLCDAIGRSRTSARVQIVLPRSPALETLARTCSNEGMAISREAARADESGAL